MTGLDVHLAFQATLRAEVWRCRPSKIPQQDVPLYAYNLDYMSCAAVVLSKESCKMTCKMRFVMWQITLVVAGNHV